MRVYIPTGNAISLKVVSYTLSKVLQKAGMIPFVSGHFYPEYVLKKRADAVIFNYPADPVYARSYVGNYVTFKRFYGDKMMFYTTVEGRPRRVEVLAPMWNYVEFIANSNYTKRKLEEAGLKVEAVVPHGIDFEKVRAAKQKIPILKQRLEKMIGDKVSFCYVGSTHKRKNVVGLMNAVEILNLRENNDFVVLLLTETVETPKNVYKVAEMGSRPYDEVLAFIGACDFFVTPTQGEGFGLPVLEAMAMGKIALHCAFEPLTEFSDPRVNITWDYDRIETFELEGVNRGGLTFELHHFLPDKIADAMEEAIALKRDEPDEYKARCKQNEKIAKRFDAKKTYKYFVDRLKR